MKRAKPSWTITNVTWETKKLIWKHWASGETVSETARYFEEHIDSHAVYSRHTISRVRDELIKLPVSKLIQLLSELPEVEDFVKEIRPDYAEKKVEESNRLAQYNAELTTTALTIATNLEKYQNEPITFHGTERDRVGEIVYGGWWLGEERARLGDVDKKLAARLLSCLKEEGKFPELDNIQDWSELNDTQITVNFILRLISRAHRGNF